MAATKLVDGAGRTVPDHLVEVGSFFAQGYQPVLDFAGWRVAMLRYGKEVDPGALHQVERHWNTNEVFILTAGQADLLILDGDEAPLGPGHVIPMVHSVAYNVGQSVWHHVLMSPDAHIVLIERTETGLATSDYAKLAPDVIAGLLLQMR